MNDPSETQDQGYDFGGKTFDLEDPKDRDIVRFILSQALYGEATAVYCGKSLFQARSLEAAKFYARQARQELGHLQLFADIFKILDLEPEPAHWVIRLLSTHNNYYPLKVLLEHAVGEGMVLDIFKDLLLQTLPDSDPRTAEIKKKLRVICREEAEHVAWGEKETKRMLADKPWLRTPYYGLIQLQLASLPWLVERFRSGYGAHPVMSQLEPFLKHVEDRVRAQGRALGYIPKTTPGLTKRALSISAGLGLYVRSRFAKSRSKLEKTYLAELGFESR